MQLQIDKVGYKSKTVPYFICILVHFPIFTQGNGFPNYLGLSSFRTVINGTTVRSQKPQV